ncbi:MAG: class III signal peptide-containing protein [Thermococcus sp.]|uniref:class III signal peptide-containing protein n=1 Tax=Thermococcus sp. TaxID=35749 RepID=UPI002612436D|nr:class III signal peptide-containing protein [Thermococcus sp.]
MRRAQTALEYLFMLAAVLVLVLMATRVVLNSMRDLNRNVNNYVDSVRRELLENL